MSIELRPGCDRDGAAPSAGSRRLAAAMLLVVMASSAPSDAATDVILGSDPRPEERPGTGHLRALRIRIRFSGQERESRRPSNREDRVEVGDLRLRRRQAGLLRDRGDARRERQRKARQELHRDPYRRGRRIARRARQDGAAEVEGRRLLVRGGRDPSRDYDSLLRNAPQRARSVPRRRAIEDGPALTPCGRAKPKRPRR